MDSKPVRLTILGVRLCVNSLAAEQIGLRGAGYRRRYRRARGCMRVTTIRGNVDEQLALAPKKGVFQNSESNRGMQILT